MISFPPVTAVPILTLSMNSSLPSTNAAAPPSLPGTPQHIWLWASPLTGPLKKTAKSSKSKTSAKSGKRWEPGEAKNFFSREKKFFASPGPPPLFKKSGVWLLPLVAAGGMRIFLNNTLFQHILPRQGQLHPASLRIDYAETSKAAKPPSSHLHCKTESFATSHLLLPLKSSMEYFCLF